MSKRLQPIKLDNAINIIRSWQDYARDLEHTFNMMSVVFGNIAAGLQQHQEIDKTRDAELEKHRNRELAAEIDKIMKTRCRARAATVSFDTIIGIDNIVH